jgi:prepilin-type N-terminal cleavage/methylation domain-containing protein
MFSYHTGCVKRSRGFSLLELLIVVALSSVVILAATKLLTSSYLLSDTSEQLVNMQLQGNLALANLKYASSIAGFNTAVAIPENRYISSRDTRSDSLTIKYLPDTDTIGNRDCLGTKRYSAQTLSYYIRSKSSSPFKSWDFMCIGARYPDSIASNIKQLQLLYGVDLGRVTADGLDTTTRDGNVDVYLPATQLEPQMHILSIRYGLLLVSTKSFTRKLVDLPAVISLWGDNKLLLDREDSYLQRVMRSSAILLNAPEQ